MNATAALPIVGVDLAKSVFQLAVTDSNWRIVERQRLTRTRFERWFANRAVGLVVMQACGSAHYWARWLTGLGIEVRLLPAPYVRAYVKRNKTDAADAEALLEAARCADIVPVRVKSVDEQALQALHRMRSLWMATRIARINALRGFCREFGISIALGARIGLEQIARVLAEPKSAIPDLVRPTMKLLVQEIRLLEARVAQLEREHTQTAPASAACATLLSIPGVGLLTATAMVAATATCACSSPTAHARCCARPPRPAAPSTAFAPGRSPCRGEPITTRRPARSRTSSHASAARACAIARPTAKLDDRKRRSPVPLIRCPPERARTHRPTRSPHHRLRRD